MASAGSKSQWDTGGSAWHETAYAMELSTASTTATRCTAVRIMHFSPSWVRLSVYSILVHASTLHVITYICDIIKYFIKICTLLGAPGWTILSGVILTRLIEYKFASERTLKIGAKIFSKRLAYTITFCYIHYQDVTKYHNMSCIICICQIG